MKTVIITHEVKNYSDWRKVYDADEVNRSKAGLKLIGVFQSKSYNSGWRSSKYRSTYNFHGKS